MNFLVFIFLLFTSVIQCQVVDTTNGKIQGTWIGHWWESKVARFAGIPYAQPPMGQLRWAPTEPVKSWAPNTWSGTNFRSSCPQTNHEARSMDEDCLYLNVWTPENVTFGKPLLPVWFWIHGGSWESGAGSMPLYSGEALTRHHNIVVVTINYRLSALGYLGGKIFAGNNTLKTTGNWGLLDQREAMRWVQKNIQAFGGDPSKITILGESAGSGSVADHLVMPGSWGLFRAAVMESGPFAHWTARPQSVAQVQYEKFVADLGCQGKSDILQCLRSASVEEVLKADAHVIEYTTTWSPVIDGTELPDDPSALAKAGKFARVPVLMGINHDEGTLFLRNLSTSISATDYREYISKRYGPYASEIEKYYPVEDFKSPWWAGVAVLEDTLMICPARRTARWLTSYGNPVYFYYWVHEIELVKLVRPELGVFHGSEIFFVFESPDGEYYDVPIVFTPGEMRLQDQLSAFWSQFVTSLDPNLPSLHSWPLFNKTENVIVLNEQTSLQQNLRQKRCDFWDSSNYSPGS